LLRTASTRPLPDAAAAAHAARHPLQHLLPQRRLHRQQPLAEAAVAEVVAAPTAAQRRHPPVVHLPQAGLMQAAADVEDVAVETPAELPRHHPQPQRQQPRRRRRRQQAAAEPRRQRHSLPTRTS
jgi:hypothetical protein